MTHIQPEVGPPSEGALRWVAETVAPGATAESVRQLTGGITSAVHVVTVIDPKGRHHRCVLRRWVERLAEEGPELVGREARILEGLERTSIPSPRLLATDPNGEACGDPALLMTYLDGHVELTPRDPEDWVQQLASVLVRVHDVKVEAPAAESWLNRESLIVPAWSKRPDLWREAFAVIDEAPPNTTARFVHHDYQQFNVLWRRGRLTSVVDWVWGSTGSTGIDVGHCRLNLSVLYSSELAQRFADHYESMSGTTVDRWWEISELLVYLPGWGGFLQQQAGRRLLVDFEGMHERVEATLLSVLRRD